LEYVTKIVESDVNLILTHGLNLFLCWKLTQNMGTSCNTQKSGG